MSIAAVIRTGDSHSSILRVRGPPMNDVLHLLRLLFQVSTLLLCLLAGRIAEAQVGYRQLDLAGVPVTLVYPTEAVSSPWTTGSFTIDVAVDAEPSPGRHRLIVMSHGTGGHPLVYHTLASTFVRAGFVVAQPVHAGDNARDAGDAGPVSWQRRPGEIVRVIDALAADPAWGSRLRFDRIGVHGESAGGLTALALAGGRWRMLDLVRHCLEHGEEDFGFCYAGLPATEQQAARRARYESARDVPDRHLPETLTAVHGGREADDPRIDPRIAAVTVSVPAAAVFSADSLRRIAIPVGVVRVGRDRMLAPALHSRFLLDQCGRCTLLADLPSAGHFDLLSPFPEDVARRTKAAHPGGQDDGTGLDAAERQVVFDHIAGFMRTALGE